MRKYTDFLLLSDATIIYMKLAKQFKVDKQPPTLEEEMFLALNGKSLPDVLESVAYNMQCSRPGNTYVYTITYPEEEPKTYIALEVLAYALPVLLKKPLEEFEDNLNRVASKKIVK